MTIIILPVNAKHTIDEKPTKLNERNTYFRWSFPFIQTSYLLIASFQTLIALFPTNSSLQIYS